MTESKFDKFLSEAEYRSNADKRDDLKKEEGHDTYYNVMKTKKGEYKPTFVKQFTYKSEATSYAKACNNKSTTHNFTVEKD